MKLFSSKKRTNRKLNSTKKALDTSISPISPAQTPAIVAEKDELESSGNDTLTPLEIEETNSTTQQNVTYTPTEQEQEQTNEKTTELEPEQIVVEQEQQNNVKEEETIEKVEEVNDDVKKDVVVEENKNEQIEVQQSQKEIFEEWKNEMMAQVKEMIMNEVKTQLDVKDATIATLNQQLEQLKQENSQLSSKIMNLESQFTTTQDQLQTKISEVENHLITEQDQLKLNITEVKEKQETDLSKSQDNQEKTKNVQMKIIEMKQAINEIEEKLVSQSNILPVSENTLRLLKTKVSLLEAKDQQLSEQYQSIYAQVIKLNQYVLNNRDIKIFVEQKNGKGFYVKGKSVDTVFYLKKLIQNKIGNDVYTQFLTYKGRVLEDGFTLNDYNIVDGNYLLYNK